MEPVLEIEGLRVEFPLRDETLVAVDDVTLSIGAGEIVGVVGESGAGKSTVGAAITGLLQPPGQIAAGRIRVKGAEIDATDARAMRALRGRRVSTIFQDPLTSLNPLFTVERQLVDTIRTHRSMSLAEARAEAVRQLDAVGIPDPARRVKNWPHEFSGGMRQRAVIALALCSNPELVIADEPTTALDVSVQAQILQLIKTLAQERGIGVMLITHDMGVIAQVTDRVAVMQGGRLVELGLTRKVLEQPEHPYSRALISVVPRMDVKRDRFPVAGLGKGVDAALEWLSAGTRAISAPDGPLVELRDVAMTYGARQGLFSRKAGFTALTGIDLKIGRGEVLGLAGESGSGKSTMARILAGLTPPSHGEMLFAGRNVFTASRSERMEIRRQTQMVFQDPYSSLNPRMKVGDILAEPLLHHRFVAGNAAARPVVSELLDAVGLPADAAQRYPHAFSGGQRQRISIARALASRPSFLICDEPTSALDVSIQAQILNLMKDLQEKLGLTILFISHDLPVVRQMCDRVAVLQGGELREVALTEQLFTKPQHPYVQRLLSLIPAMPASAAIGGARHA
ncbi:dipeptide ABC transporter ATP-binding protein [Mesorhizobium australicum]|uniref:Peptide/nickel transport system ATP-binding protein n=1 Tax=Mesorhizobium australicum TaxID=536018 RepID=A0A1X7NIF0_9HYPH|nr:ABC transporter ATP-binding protein [Mesorhizobium australicum]SMH36960.1 peptide/nickel transport system ATP-binding protein [Mesorhizobium australicum]